MPSSTNREKKSPSSATYGWSNAWRDFLGTVLKEFVPHLSLGETLLGGSHSDWGSELFGAAEEYSTREQRDMLKQLTGAGKNDWSGILKDVSTSDSKEANLVEELLGIDVDSVAAMSDEEFSQLQEMLEQKIAGLQKELE